MLNNAKYIRQAVTRINIGNIHAGTAVNVYYRYTEPVTWRCIFDIWTSDGGEVQDVPESMLESFEF